ncbi:hypothetical protein V6N11_067394 [Hibiscus sabdariffa]|uniref:RNase H type-1 domain-containing protein n=1 Tax=Hibiscus sabdariffa TaxID=183260 RepID=A0ABR2SQS7_9ROSI
MEWSLDRMALNPSRYWLKFVGGTLSMLQVYYRRRLLLEASIGSGLLRAAWDDIGSWTSLLEGWWKLNTDGAGGKGDGFMTCGGVIRDANGSWVRQIYWSLF